jgi:hypothetical protein
MPVRDDVDEIAALHGNSEVMRFIGGRELTVGSVLALTHGRVHDRPG